MFDSRSPIPVSRGTKGATRETKRRKRLNQKEETPKPKGATRETKRRKRENQKAKNIF